MTYWEDAYLRDIVNSSLGLGISSEFGNSDPFGNVSGELGNGYHFGESYSPPASHAPDLDEIEKLLGK